MAAGKWIAAFSILGAVTGCSTSTIDPPLMVGKQGSFFVGGKPQYQTHLTENTMLTPDKGTVVNDQVYVSFQEPVKPQKVPLVLIHGCCLTGKTWETTPDGRMGWNELFVRNGYPTYVIDQASRGRSAANTASIVAVKQGAVDRKKLPAVSRAPAEGAWSLFRFGPRYPEPYQGMQFPLEAQDEFWKQLVPDWYGALPQPNPTIGALAQLTQNLQGAVLVSHSQSGFYPFEVAKIPQADVRAIVAIEPGACPSPSSDLAPYTHKPILIVWGDNTQHSSHWKPLVAQCKAFEQAANQSGGKVSNVMLNDVGLPGASHMPMLDRHSIAIGQWLTAWLDQQVPLK